MPQRVDRARQPLGAQRAERAGSRARAAPRSSPCFARAKPALKSGCAKRASSARDVERALGRPRSRAAARSVLRGEPDRRRVGNTDAKVRSTSSTRRVVGLVEVDPLRVDAARREPARAPPRGTRGCRASRRRPPTGCSAPRRSRRSARRSAQQRAVGVAATISHLRVLRGAAVARSRRAAPRAITPREISATVHARASASSAASSPAVTPVPQPITKRARGASANSAGSSAGERHRRVVADPCCRPTCRCTTMLRERLLVPARSRSRSPCVVGSSS